MAAQLEISQTNSSAKLDVISNLPKEMKEKILNYLPIKEAGRTSILSSTWRHTWKSIPDLVIHCDFISDVAKTVELVSKVLALHEGPIHKFDLQAAFSPTNALEWICQLSKNEIKELSLHVPRFQFWEYTYEFSLNLFSCHYLSFLSLKDFDIKMPARLGSMKLLRTLELVSIGINENDLEKLISCCPVLENLTIRDYCSVSTVGLRICAPNLRKLYLSSGWSYCIELCAPKLITLCLAMRVCNHKLEISNFDFNKLFSGLPSLEVLELKPYFLYNFLDEEIVGGRFILPNLKEMSLNTLGLDQELPKILPVLFQNAPNLHVLRLEGLSESINREVFSFQNLQILNIIISRCDEYVLPFIKSVLASASELRKLIIIIDTHYCSHKKWNPSRCVKKEVLSLTAPTKVQIIFPEN